MNEFSPCDVLLKQWQDVPYGNLSVILVFLRYLSLVHQTNHHAAKGDSFYGDHLLFDRLYNAVIPEIDLVAEKAVGAGGAACVDMFAQAAQISSLVQGHRVFIRDIPTSSDMAYSSLAAELLFQKSLEKIVSSSFNSQQRLTKGIDNMLAQIQDTHESHIYLLKQRIQL